MKLEESMRSIFPDEEQVPEVFLFNVPTTQDQFLINGELCHWDGPTQEVLSPVCVGTSSGLFRKCVGRDPILAEKESFKRSVLPLKRLTMVEGFGQQCRWLKG